MIACPTVTQSEIRYHYDLATLFYRLLWGPHIHHGLWTGSESPAIAQQHLTDTLAACAVQPGDAVVDVGCGMGGSSIHLRAHARLPRYGNHARARCNVAGPARRPAGKAYRGGRDFSAPMPKRLCCPRRAFDVVWCVECTEHLFDKAAFFRRAATWLRPGGRMAICAWLAAEPPHSPGAQQLIHDVCEGFLCPSLGTMTDYQRWMTDAGLVMRHAYDWTPRVTKTWEICLERIRRARLGTLARLIGSSAACFLDRFETILEAYRTGAMKYGAFVFEAQG